MTAAYDNDNIFAKILRGEIPCTKVFEDEKTLTFLDIMPRAPGHALVIPKNAARTVLDISQDDLAAVIATVQKIARAQMKAFAADGITIQQFNEGAGGQVVFHLHFHVIPRHDGIAMKPPATEMATPDDLAIAAKKIMSALE